MRSTSCLKFIICLGDPLGDCEQNMPNGIGVGQRSFEKNKCHGYILCCKYFLNNLGKREILVNALRRAYHRKYTHDKPVPSNDVSLCVSDLYIECAIKVLDRSKGETDPCRWTAIQSRHDLLKPLKDGTRILIDGEPGYGKSTLLRRYAYDFCNQSSKSPVNRFSIFVLLPLKELCNVKCIYQAIRSQLPDDNSLTAEAIKDVIKDNVSALLICFDGFDEYSDRGSPQSFVAQIMNNKLLEQCTAICSTRKGYSPHLPSPTMKHFRLSGFNNDMQKKYIKKAFGSTENAGVLTDRILRQLQQNPAFDAICKVPLFFVVFAHNRGNEEITENLDTVTGFFAQMMKTLLDHQRNKDAPDQHIDSLLEPLLQQLAKLAFNGLCSQNQKLSWEAPELNQLIDMATLEMLTFSGILVQEEMPYIAKTPGANESFWKTSKTHFRFFHKIFQEYFAALHISGLAKQKDTEHLAKEALVNLNHIELQYVYRFACGLNKATAKIILDLFTKNSKASHLFATLCLLETNSEDKYNEVREYCCSGLVVNHYDSKSLQTSTIQLLQVASHQKIPLPSLELSCCVKSVILEQETLLLFSGLVISKLDTVEELTLTFTNCVDMAASLLGLFSRTPVLKAVRFKHSTLPRSFDDRSVLSDLESNQCE
ncbi:putative NACHT, LRR and PYD domains-containing protein 3-like isoform X2, partial [Apostichopus japonicus]